VGVVLRSGTPNCTLQSAEEKGRRAALKGKDEAGKMKIPGIFITSFPPTVSTIVLPLVINQEKFSW
jgi:hypothetical protein